MKMITSTPLSLLPIGTAIINRIYRIIFMTFYGELHTFGGRNNNKGMITPIEVVRGRSIVREEIKKKANILSITDDNPFDE